MALVTSLQRLPEGRLERTAISAAADYPYQIAHVRGRLSCPLVLSLRPLVSVTDVTGKAQKN
jgi:hypothetical protein